MPSWCDNRLRVTGDPASLTEFTRRVAGRINDEDSALSLNALVPEPAEHEEGADWYSWRLEQWGTKWDVDLYASDIQDRHASYEFLTAWAPPVSWLEQVARNFPLLDFALSYYEPGCYAFGKVIGFCGVVLRVCSEEEFTSPLEFLREEFPDNPDISYWAEFGS